MAETTDGWAPDPAFLKGSTLTANVAERYLLVAGDRVELTLRKYADALQARNEWHTPAGILATLVATLATVQFQPALWLSADTWKALFVFIALACMVWLGRALNRRRQSGDSGVERIMEQLWRESDNPERQPPANTAMNPTNREVPGMKERRPSGEPEHG